MERMEVSSSEKHFCATSVWASVRNQICDGWDRVIPEEEGVF